MKEDLYIRRPLSNSLDKAANEGVIHESQISPSAPIITHLLFADD